MDIGMERCLRDRCMCICRRRSESDGRSDPQEMSRIKWEWRILERRRKSSKFMNRERKGTYMQHYKVSPKEGSNVEESPFHSVRTPAQLGFRVLISSPELSGRCSNTVPDHNVK